MSFGQVYVNYIGNTSYINPVSFLNVTRRDYQAAILVNTTSCMAPGIWGSYMHEVFLRNYLKTVNHEKAARNLKLKVSLRPLPLTK